MAATFYLCDMRYFISAGEASGDLHASRLIASLREKDPEARFTFLGGDLMAAEAGHRPLLHFRDMAFMGFSEVIRNFGRIGRNLALARETLEKERPDALIVVDYPDFNLKLAATAKKLAIPVYYFIPPKVWAWKKWRIRSLRRLCRRLLCIFPFEVDFYKREGVDVDYVGNPSVEEIDSQIAVLPPAEDYRYQNDLTSRPLLLLVPGSRRGELRNNLPVMASVARRRRDMQAVVAGAPGIDMEFYRSLTTLPVIYGETVGLMANARAALVTSGTATLECALAGTPQVACYRANGSRLSYSIMRRLLNVDYVTLPNLIAGAPVVPEMLLHYCTPEAVGLRLAGIVADGPEREKQLEGYAVIRRRLGEAGAARRAADIIINDLRNNG